MANPKYSVLQTAYQLEINKVLKELAIARDLLFPNQE